MTTMSPIDVMKYKITVYMYQSCRHTDALIKKNAYNTPSVKENIKNIEFFLKVFGY